jgi:hypothetical protein
LGWLGDIQASASGRPRRDRLERKGVMAASAMAPPLAERAEFWFYGAALTRTPVS